MGHCGINCSILSVLQEGFHKSGNPNLVLTVEELAGMEDVEVGTCVFEHVPPDMIDLFIFNM